MIKLEALPPIPEETKRIAKKAFRKGNRYLTLRDELGSLLQSEGYAGLYSSQGQPGLSPLELNLLLVVEQMEGLSDRDVVEAVVSRIDLKYLLGKPLDYSGFDASVLSEFRQRLIEGKAESQLFEQILTICCRKGWLKASGKQRTDSTHVLAAIRNINRYELVGETMRKVLNAMATVAPEWLQGRTPSAWFARYSTRIEEYRLPEGGPAHQRWAEQVGADGLLLLQWLEEETTPAYLKQLPAVATLRTIWQQQYDIAGTTVRWRKAGELPSVSEMIQSPHDAQARYSQKREMEWTGYKVHFTETCDEQVPHLVTQVTTTPAPLPDCQATAPIQAELAEKQRLPAQHIVDAGYSDAQLFAESQTHHQITLISHAAPDLSWQAKAQQGYAQADFQLDWQQQVATCPQGHSSLRWIDDPDAAGNPSWLVRFPDKTCLACPVRACCTRSAHNGRSLRLLPYAHHQALQQARHSLSTSEFKQLYANRSGIEATFSLSVRSLGLRCSRYIGQTKTHLQNLCIASALNLMRIADFLLGLQPAPSRTSPFARLAPTAA